MTHVQNDTKMNFQMLNNKQQNNKTKAAILYKY